jgi:hypothetical protein
LLSFVGGNVLAKYQSQISGHGEASVATWKFSVNANTEKIKTITLAKSYDESTLKGGKIAPGTSGMFQLALDASGAEVGIDYMVKFLNESSKPSNLKFEYEGVKYNSIKDLESVLTGTIEPNDGNRVRLLNISWEWEYETGDTEEDIALNDAIDTKESVQLSNYSFDVVVTGTQMMPQE